MEFGVLPSALSFPGFTPHFPLAVAALSVYSSDQKDSEFSVRVHVI